MPKNFETTAQLHSSRILGWRRRWQPTPVFLLGESQGRRSLVGCRLWGRTELDTTERLHFHVLEKETATHSSVLAWKIPGMGAPRGLPSMGSYRVGHNWSDLAAAGTILLPSRYLPRQTRWRLEKDRGYLSSYLPFVYKDGMQTWGK